MRREKTKEEFTKRKRDERKKTLHEGKLQGHICREKQEHCTQVVRKVDKEWVFEERERVHVICNLGAGTKNQYIQSKQR